MRVAVVYVFPMVEQHTYLNMARRFVSTWKSNPAGIHPHELHVMLNGGPAQPHHLDLFRGLASRFHVRDNYGWDIGAFLESASTIPCDLLVCLGAHIQFHHPGWLDRVVNSVVENGPGLYGPWGAMYPTPHIRTTAFWCQPPILSSYPHPVNSYRPSRYRFEHSEDSFTAHARSLGFPTIMVTQQGCYDQPDWKGHEPDRENSIILDKQHA